ncbi:hypothetical protein NQZ68_041854 [Dissostichus eleginoides]|nr:hypothetical protein NQZ68_041854 [Dissostichus eleginoides]
MGNPRPFDHGAVADRAYRQIHCRNGQINGLDEYHMAFGQERVSFSHRMRIEKDKVKRLEEVLKYRNSGLDQDNKRLFDVIQDREAEISRLKDQMEAAEHQHKQQLDHIVATSEAEKGKISDQKNQETSDSQNNDVPQQCDPEKEKLRMRKGETMKELMREGEELLECVTILEDRNSDLKEEMEAKLKRVEKQKNDLAKKNKSWESDVKQLKDQMRVQEEKFSKDLAQNQQSWEAKVHLVEIKLKEVEEEKNDLAQKHQSREKDLKEVQAQLKMVEDEKKDSAMKNLSLEKEVQLKNGRVKQLENDLDEQKERFSKDLAQNQDSWETKVNLVEIKLKEVTQEKNDLAQKHQSREKDLKEGQAKLRKAEDEEKDSSMKNQILEKKVQLKEMQVKQMENQLDEQKEMFSNDLAPNQEIWETKVHLTETRWKQVEEQRDDLAQGQLSWEAKEKKMEEEKKLLEDLCLHMKNKSRGFFSRRRDTEDRDVTLSTTSILSPSSI